MQNLALMFRERPAAFQHLSTCGTGCRIGLLLLVVGVIVPARSAASQDDVEGASDHPLVSRFDGSRIIAYDMAEFDEYRVVTSRVKIARNGVYLSEDKSLVDENSLRLEGKVTRITYKAPETSSTLQILRSYEKALDELGATYLMACSGNECSDHRERFAEAVIYGTGYYFSGSIKDVRYLSSRVDRTGGDLYVSVLVVGLRQPWVQLDVVEVEGLVDGLVTADAAALARDLDARGSALIQGIYFETGRSELTSASKPALMEVARLLSEEPKLHLFIVGHTDTVGDFEANLALSEARAHAVVDALVSSHGVENSRVTARGIGPLAPVAPNTTEQGRAQNRRVMLVVR
jgi:OOP family OmpA-OmpF porin